MNVLDCLRIGRPAFVLWVTVILLVLGAAACQAAPKTATPTVTTVNPKFAIAHYDSILRADEPSFLDDRLKPAGTVLSSFALQAHQSSTPIVLNSTVQTTDITLPTYAGSTLESAPGATYPVPTNGSNPPTNIDPVWSNDGTFVVFASNRTSVTNPVATSTFHLFYLSASGYDPANPDTFVQLTSGSDSQRYPSLIGSDDTQIVYCDSPTANGTYTLEVATFVTAEIGVNDGQVIQDATPLAAGLDVRHPSSSGQFLIFAGRQPNQTVFHIYTVSTTGTLQQITSGPADEESPSFSPDGSLVSFDTNASGYATGGSTPLTSGGVSATNQRAVWVTPISGIGVVQLTASGSDNVQPAWTKPGQNPFINPENDQQYIFFASDRGGTYGIYFLRADSSNEAAQTIVDTEGQDNSGIGPNTAVQVNTSDPDNTNNDTAPSVYTPPQGNPLVIYSSDRYLVNTPYDNPETDPGNVNTSYPPITTTASSTIAPSSPLDSSLNLEVLESRLFDIAAPTLVRYSEQTTEVVHIESPATPGVASKFITPGTQAAIVVRVSDRQSGIKNVWLQIKDPDSKYQDAGGLEHKVYTRWSEGYGELPTFPNEDDEATTLGNAYYIGLGGVENGTSPGGSDTTTDVVRANEISANVPQPVEVTTLSVAAAVGATTITVADASNLEDDEAILIDNNNQELDTITGIDTVSRVVTLGTALVYAHSAGAPVYSIPNGAGIGVVSASTKDSATITLKTPGQAAQFLPGDTVTVAGFTTMVIQTIVTQSTGQLVLYDAPPSYAPIPANAIVVRVAQRTFDPVGNEVDCQALDTTVSPFDATNPIDYDTPTYTPGVEDAGILSGVAFPPPASQNNPGSYWLQLAPLATTLANSVTAGSDTFTVSSIAGFVAGDTVQIDTGPNSESATIASTNGATVTLVNNLIKSHAIGAQMLEQQSVGGGVLYSALWTTPLVPSDYYMDVIAYDNASWPIPYNLQTGYEGQKQNWRIFDNVGGFTTQNFITKSNILVVSDYALPQKFFGRGGVQEINNADIGGIDFGAESYITGVDVDYNDPVYVGAGLRPPAVLPTDAVGLFASATASNLVTPILDGTNQYADWQYHPAITTEFGPDFDKAQNTYFGGTGNGLGYNSYADPDMTDFTSTPPNVESQQYDIWRILSRGPVPTTILADYTPSVQTQPAAPTPTQVTTLSAAAAVAATTITVAAPLALQVGETILIDSTNQETDTITAIVIGTGVVTLNTPLAFAHAKGAPIFSPTGVAQQVVVANGCVLWLSPFTGDEFAETGTLADLSTQSLLTTYLNAGGRLLVEGIDVGYSLTSDGSVANTFYNSYLNAKFQGDTTPGRNVQTFILSKSASGEVDYISHDAYVNNNDSFDDNGDAGNIGHEYFIYPPQITNFDNGPEIGPYIYNPPVTDKSRPGGAAKTAAPLPTISNFGFAPLTELLVGQNLVNDGSLNADTLSVPTDMDQFGIALGASLEPTELIGTGGTQALVYSGSPLNNVLSPGATSQIGASIVAYSSFGLETLTQEIEDFPMTDGSERYVCDNQRTDLLHNLVCMMRTGTMTGQITSSNSGAQPIQGAIVRCSLEVDAGVNLPSSPTYTGTTDANGNYLIGGLPPGKYDVDAFYTPATGGSGFIHVTGSAAIVHGNSSGVVNLIINQPPPASLTVNVVDASTGAPVSDATVTLTEAAPGTLIYTAQSNAFGSAVFSNVVPSFYTMTVSAPTYQSYSQASSTLSASAAAGATTIDVVASTPAFASGDLISVDSGANIEQVSVSMIDTTGTVLTISPALALNHAAGAPVDQEIQVLSGANTPLTVPLTGQPGTVSGTVTASGSGVSGASVTLLSSDGSTAAGPVLTGATGSFTISNVTPGSYTLTVTAVGYNAAGVSLTVVRGTTVTENITLTLAPPTGFSGTVVQETNSAPLPGVTVTVTTGSSTTPVATATTDNNGNYSFSQLSAGTFTATVTDSGFETKSQNVTLSSGQLLAGVNFSLLPAGNLIVTVDDDSNPADIVPVVGVQVTATNTGGAPIYGPAATNASGVADFQGVETGSYNITVNGAGQEYLNGAQYAEVVTQGNTTSVTIDLLPQPANISGTVITSDPGQPDDGNPIANATVTFTLGSTVEQTVESNSSGVYTTSSPGVPAGTYTIQASAPGFATETPITVPVTRGENSTGNTIDLSPVANVYGLVYRSWDSQPVSNVVLNLYDTNGNLVGTTTSGATFTGVDGQSANFLFSPVPVGIYTLKVVAPSYLPVSPITVSVTAGSGVRVPGNIDLSPLATFTPVQPSANNFGLQMISEPYNFTESGATLSDLLGGLPNPLVATWLPSLSEYAITPTPPDDTFHRGVGYWIRLEQTVGLVGVPDPEANTPFAIGLSPGWNMIGDPWSSAVTLADIQLSDIQGNLYSWTTGSSTTINLVSSVIYSYDPVNQVYVSHYIGKTDAADPTSTVLNEPNPAIQPYLGYWVLAYTTCSLQVPNP